MMKTSRKKLLCAILSITLVLGTLFQSFAANAADGDEAELIIELGIPGEMPAVGELYTVNVDLFYSSSSAACNLFIDYDKTVLKPVDALSYNNTAGFTVDEEKMGLAFFAGIVTSAHHRVTLATFTFEVLAEGEPNFNGYFTSCVDIDDRPLTNSIQINDAYIAPVPYESKLSLGLYLPDKELITGDNFTVSLVAYEAMNISEFTLRFTYDPTVVKPVSKTVSQQDGVLIDSVIDEENAEFTVNFSAEKFTITGQNLLATFTFELLNYDSPKFKGKFEKCLDIDDNTTAGRINVIDSRTECGVNISAPEGDFKAGDTYSVEVNIVNARNAAAFVLIITYDNDLLVPVSSITHENGKIEKDSIYTVFSETKNDMVVAFITFFGVYTKTELPLGTFTFNLKSDGEPKFKAYIKEVSDYNGMDITGNVYINNVLIEQTPPETTTLPPVETSETEEGATTTAPPMSYETSTFPQYTEITTAYNPGEETTEEPSQTEATTVPANDVTTTMPLTIDQTEPTEEVTTKEAVTEESTTVAEITTAEITTEQTTSDVITTAPSTNSEITTDQSTNNEITTAQITTAQNTTEAKTTEESTTATDVLPKLKDSADIVLNSQKAALFSAKQKLTLGDLLKEFENDGITVKNSLGETITDSSAVIGSGFTVSLGGSEEFYSYYLLGDLNSDGEITAVDARIVLRASAELDKLNDWQKVIAEIDDSNQITATDARIILRLSADLEKIEPWLGKQKDK